MALEKEIEVYDRELPNLLREHEGKWVLIHGETIDSLWQTGDDAYDAGCDKFGLEPFLVMPVKIQKPLPLLFPVKTLE
jgi:hypothetical protein